MELRYLKDAHLIGISETNDCANFLIDYEIPKVEGSGIKQAIELNYIEVWWDNN